MSVIKTVNSIVFSVILDDGKNADIIYKLNDNSETNLSFYCSESKRNKATIEFDFSTYELSIKYH